MKFQYLENFYKDWKDILVISKTLERDGRRYHILGMTLDEEAKLYIIEPYHEPEHNGSGKKGIRNQRKILKEHGISEGYEVSYLHCKEFYLGEQKLEVRSASGGPLKYSVENYGEIQVFFDMLRAGWKIPEWLKNEDWDNLQLLTFVIADMEKLPEYFPEMPIVIKHEQSFIQHILEKTVTLNVGQSRSFHFIDNYDDKVTCYINDVALIDVWNETEEQFKNPKYTEKFSAEQLQEIKAEFFEALEQSCPKGMCFIGVEYECSKDLGLQFYSKEFLKSYPEQCEGKAVSLFMRKKPEKELGTHNLPLRGYVMQTAVSPDTTKIPAELFLYLERTEAWEESIM